MPAPIRTSPVIYGSAKKKNGLGNTICASKENYTYLCVLAHYSTRSDLDAFVGISLVKPHEAGEPHVGALIRGGREAHVPELEGQ